MPFFVLHSLDHWRISKLPKDVLNLIAFHSGHDAYSTNQIFERANVLVKDVKDSNDELVKKNDDDKSSAYHHLNKNHFVSTAWGIGAALVILKSMKALPRASIWDYSFGFDGAIYRKYELNRLTAILKRMNESRGMPKDHPAY